MANYNFNNYEKYKVNLFNENAYCKDFSKINKIIENMKQDGQNQLHIIADFDWTLSKYEVNGTRTPLSYDVFLECDFIDAEVRTKYKTLKEIYLPIYMNYDYDPNDKRKKMLEWWDILNGLIFEAKINLNKLKSSIKASNISLRDCVTEFFERLEEKQIPILIISGGFGNVVIELLEENKILSDKIKVLSNTVEFDENGDGKKFISETIHMYNKNEAVMLDGDYYKLIENRRNVILIGDAEGDNDMAKSLTSIQNIIKIGFLNTKSESLLETYLNLFDLVIVDDSTFSVPNKILQHLIS